MSHTIGRLVDEEGTRIDSDSATSSPAPDTWEFEFMPESASDDGPPRFVILQLTDLDLPGDAELQVELGTETGDTDTFERSTGSKVWTRPINPKPGPVVVRYVGSDTTGGATLVKYALGERSKDGEPGSDRGSLSNPDFFLHTASETETETEADTYDEPIYETRLECGSFDWLNAAAAPAGSAEQAAARATCILVFVHRNGTELSVSSCSGTLIDSDLVLTARHCLAETDELDVESASVTFDYATTADGVEPTDYDPTFHKVVDVVDADLPPPGINPPPIRRDWVVLQIDTPPGGLDVSPRPLRRDTPMAGESVTTVHHPNGAVKKMQQGTLSTRTVTEVEGFDFAGGSSGSALFDSDGQVLGGALSKGPLEEKMDDPCWAGYTPVDSILEGIAAPDEPPSPLDVMLVLDRSGSMSGPGTGDSGLTKLEEAKDAASEFVGLVRTGGDDRIGMVSFSTEATSPPESPPEAVTDAKKEEVVGDSPSAPGGTVGALSAGGTTSIGDGIREAMDALSPPSGNQRTLLLLTDGLQNTPPMIEDVEDSLGDTHLCIVGYGQEDALDGPLLTSLARDHDGLYTRANDGIALKKFFALCFGDIFESGMLSDPEVSLGEGQDEAAPTTFEVCGEETITVVVGWDTPDADLEAEIETPGGTGVTDETPDVVTSRGRTWWFARIPLPVDGERDGRWRATVTRRPTTDEFAAEPEATAFLSVIADGGPELDPLPPDQRVYTGDPLNPRVELRYSDGTAPHADVDVTVESPDESLGAMVAEEGLVSPRLDGDPVDAFRATLEQIADRSGGTLPLRTSTETFELFDDGAHDDGAMERDGIYGNNLADLTAYEGTYSFHATARYGLDCDAMRETRWSVHVEVGIDPDATDVEVLDESRTPDGDLTGTVRLTPRDRHGNPLGPGRGDRFDLDGQRGTTVDAVSDNGDGSYEVDVTRDPAVAGGPGLVARQPDRDPVPITPPSSGWSCPRWLCWALVLALLVVFLVEFLRRLRGMSS